ncbi:hypothetical protein ACWXWB_22695 [Pantoea dispersa]
MMSIWDDLKAFKLRREDEAYQSTLRYGDISDRYLFVRIEPKKAADVETKTPEKDEPKSSQRVEPNTSEEAKSGKRDKVSLHVSDLLDTLYRDQKCSGSRDYIKPNMSIRNAARIRGDHISEEVKKTLASAIGEKERTLKYLHDHYLDIAKQHKQVEMITMTFHLPRDWLNVQPRERDVRLLAALGELGQRFVRFKKLITSDPLYKAACGYIRLTMMSANFEPFYLVNFFIKKLPDARIAPSLLIDLGKKWAEIFEDEDPEPRCVRYYELLDGAALARDADEQLLTLPAYKITDVGQIKNRTAKILEEKTLRKQVIDNNQKGYLALFRLQSQVHNLIPGVRTLTHSNDFTYINTEVRKRRKSKKASIGKQSKSANADAVSIDKETSGLRTSADDSTSPIDHMEPEFYDILPSNLNAHLPKNPGKRPERKVTKDI